VNIIVTFVPLTRMKTLKESNPSHCHLIIPDQRVSLCEAVGIFI